MNPIQKMFISGHVKMIRLTGGKIGGQMAGMRVLVLTTTGKKTGLKRSVPIVFIEDEAGNPVVTGSNNGGPADPAWFGNLKANPDVTYELAGKTIQAKAVIAEPALRNKLWAELTSKHKNFAEYEKKTTRTIPMVVLKPV